MMSYLIYMAIRIMELRRVLKPTGSIYLHCDPIASHYLKLLMDSLFGRKNFRNEIVWCYKSGGASKRYFARKHDIILLYAKNERDAKFYPQKVKSYGATGGGHGVVKYYRDKIGTYSIVNARDWWDISMLATTHPERTGYPTQKPLALLKRIIKASSNHGDIILDPFCGCATACIAAEMEEREWVGIDISPKAAELVERRMVKEVGVMYAGYHRTDIPERTDMGLMLRFNDIRNKKYLYGEQGGYCNGCETHFQPQHFEVDHIIPRAKGGTDHISNLQLLCSSCNKVKGTRTHEELLVRLTDKGWIKRKMAA